MIKLYSNNILVVLFLGVTTSVFSQNSNNVVTSNGYVPPQKIIKVKRLIPASQSGTAIIENGKALVKLSDTVIHAISDKANNATYEVEVTPGCSDCGQFSITERGAKSFTVKQTGGTNSSDSFTYNVYIVPKAQSNTGATNPVAK